MKIIRRYSEMIRLNSFEERFNYLKLDGVVGKDTFGFDRYINQKFYNSVEWKKLRNEIIVRDQGCDLAFPDNPIGGKILIHHLNPITMDDIVNQTDYLVNPDFLVCVSSVTHNALHYANESLLPKGIIERKPNDTCPWRTANG